MLLDKIIQTKCEAETQLFQNPDVVMVDVGRKKVNDQYTNELCITVFVSKKKRLTDVHWKRLIPREINGVKTDVLQGTSTVNAGVYRAGIYVESYYNRSSGAALGFFGFLNDDILNPTAVLVTNQHVLMDGLDTTSQGGETGPNVCSICSPCCSKVIGHVALAVLNDSVDVAAAVLKDNVQFVPEIKGIGVVKGTHNITEAEALSHTYAVKIYSLSREQVITGRVFGIHTAGTAFDDDARTKFRRNYTNQIRIVADDQTLDPWIQHGDSGSAVLNNDNEIVGIIFGNAKDSDGNLGLACPIHAVGQALGVFPASGTAPNQVYTVRRRPSIFVNGDPLDMDTILRGGSAVFPLQSKTNDYFARVSATRIGEEYEKLFRKHIDEVRNLVNSNKRVATVWHRNNGPEWLVHFSRSIENEAYFIGEIKGKDLRSALTSMAAVLKQFGSPSLIEDIDKHIDRVLLFSKFNTVDMLVSQLENYNDL